MLRLARACFQRRKKTEVIPTIAIVAAATIGYLLCRQRIHEIASYWVLTAIIALLQYFSSDCASLLGRGTQSFLQQAESTALNWLRYITRWPFLTDDTIRFPTIDHQKVASTVLGGFRFVLIVPLATALLLNIPEKEGHPLSRLLETSSVNLLRFAKPSMSRKRHSVLLIDISEVPVIQTPQGEMTDRNMLWAFLEGLSRLSPELQPLVVVINVNFAYRYNPDQTRTHTSTLVPARSANDGDEFFRRCLELRNHYEATSGCRFPVFLGAFVPPGESHSFFGDSKYDVLATAPDLNPEDLDHYLLSAPLDLHPSRPLDTIASTITKSTIGSSAAERLTPLGCRLYRQPHGRTDLDAHGHSSNRTDSFLVDYDFAKQLMDSSVRIGQFKTPEQFAKLRDKIVILGDLTNARNRDWFNVPSVSEPLPGSVVHGCAAATLTSNPIYELTEFSRVALDVCLGTWALLWYIIVTLTSGQRDSDGKWKFCFIGVVTVCFGLILVRLRIFYADCFLAGLLILLHPHLEHLKEALVEYYSHYVRHEQQTPTTTASSKG